MKSTFVRITLVLLLFSLVIAPMAILLTGCAKVIDTEYETVKVEIVNEYHRAGYSTPVRVGKVWTVRHHPALYRIHVMYNDVQYTIGGSDAWHKYKGMVGKTVSATLEIRTYDNGTVKHNITALLEE